MGAYFSTDFAIFGRDKETDLYVLVEEINEGNPMSRFKHETYAYALNKKHMDKKTLYLYCGYNRLVKCSQLVEQDTVHGVEYHISLMNLHHPQLSRETIPLWLNSR